MPSQASLFCSDNALPAALETQALQALSSQALWISVNQADETAEGVIFGVDVYPRDPHQLIISTSFDANREYPSFKDGDSVRIYWSEESYGLGARARIITNLIADKGRLAYAIRIDGPVYRQQRRDAFRVPVDSIDDVMIEFLVPDVDQPPSPDIRDLSSKGVSITLEGECVKNMGLRQGVETVLAMLFENSGQQFQTRVRLVSIEHLTGSQVAIGMQWLTPTAAFKNHLRRFIAHKERLLLRRRSGL